MNIIILITSFVLIAISKLKMHTNIKAALFWAGKVGLGMLSGLILYHVVTTIGIWMRSA